MNSSPWAVYERELRSRVFRFSVAHRRRTGSAEQAHALVELVRVGVERCAGQRCIAVDVGPALLLDRFAHAGQRLWIVARVSAGGLDPKPCPVPPRQAAT